MTTRGREYTILTVLFILLGSGTESRFCGRSCDTRGKTFHYAGHFRAKCDTHGYSVESNSACTTHENATALSTMKMVTHGSKSTKLPSKIVCQGPDPHFTGCSWGSRKNCRWRTPLVCRGIDATSLKVDCPPTQIVNASYNNNTEAIVTWDLTVCFHNSKRNISSNCTHQPGTALNIGKTTVQCNFTDGLEDTGQFSFLIIVKDVTSPTLVCPNDQTVKASKDNSTTAEVTWDTVSCSDNSENISLECTSGQSGDKFGLGNTTVYCNCTDRSENIDECTFFVMVKDVTSPTLVCPHIQSEDANKDNNTTAVVTWNTTVSCSDNSEDISLECTHQSGTKFGLGNRTVYCNCTDRSENIDECSFLVAVKDVTSPIANCPDNQTVNASSDNYRKAAVTWNTDVAALCSDNSNGTISWQCTNRSGDDFSLGETTVHCKCTDESDNVGHCSFHIMVKDVTSPTLVCPNNQTVNASKDNSTTAEVTWDTISCSDNSENISLECTSGQSGDKFGLGNTTVYCNCTDRSENIDECTFLVLVKDVTSPTLVCPKTQSEDANKDNNTTAVVTWNTVSCSDNSENISQECTHQSGDNFGLGNTTVYCNCTDRSENIDECTFLVVVKDVTSPIAHCPHNQTVNASLDNDRKAAVTWNTDVGALCSDNSNGTISWQCTNRSGDEFSLGETTVHCKCTDESDNVGHCSFHIMVKDVTSPEAKCPDDQLVKAISKNYTEADVTWKQVVCSDNSQVTIPPNCTHSSGETFKLGNTTVHCKCTDESGNTDECSFRIMVKEPAAFCPPDKSQTADIDNDTKALVRWKMPKCVGNPNANLSSACTPEPGEIFPLGNTTVNCNCTEGRQYKDQCSFTVIVKDETPPIARCPLEIIDFANHDNNTNAVVTWQLEPCSDNSNGAVLLNCSHESGDKFGLGNTTVECSCSDASGNTGQCSFNVMVKDGKGPAADCPSDQNVTADVDSNTKAAVRWKRVSCTDNSNQNIVFNCTHQSGTKFGLGSTTVKCSCIDSSANMGHCSFRILVKDETKPRVTCPTYQILNASQDSNTRAVVTWNTPSCFDNSNGDLSLHCSHQPESIFDLGNTSVKCNCTDKSENTDQCSFLIIVKDVTRPTAHCPAHQILNATLDNNTKALVTWIPASCSDDNTKGDISLDCTHNNGTKFDIGNTTIKYSCRDRSGNTGQCFFHIIVKDVTSPTADCPDNQIVNADQDGNTKAVVTWNPPSCSDNSRRSITRVCSPQSGSKISLGNTTIECSCTDRSENTGHCFFNVTVKDVTNPTATCPATKIVGATLNGNTTANVTWNPTTCSDNSGVNLSANCTHHSGTIFGFGDTTVQCSCTDMSGNVGQCSFLIVVRDITSPTATCPSGQIHYVSENEIPEAVAEWDREETNCTDNSPEAIYPQCSHESGYAFPSGNTRVICTCEDRSGNSKQCFFTIEVKVVKDPKLHERFMTKNFFEIKSGRNVSITCTADHAEEFWWKQESFRGTQNVTNSSGSGEIEIYDISLRHQGNYFCIAKGKARSVTSQPQVLVLKNYLQFAVKVTANTNFLDTVNSEVDKTLMNASFDVMHPETSEGGILKYIFKKKTNETKPDRIYNLIEEKMNSLKDKLKTFDYEMINTAYCTGGTITTTNGDLSFPDALVGKSVNSSEISLTSRVASRATRSCDGDFIHEAVWKEPVITNVTMDVEENITTSIKNLAKNLDEHNVTSSNASYVADVLQNVTASAEIETDHLETVAVALHLVVEALNVSEKVTTSVVLIIDNIVKSTSRPSNKSEVSLHSNTSASFLETLQKQLDNVRDSGLSFNFTTTNIAVRIAQVPKENIFAIYTLPFGGKLGVGIDKNVTGNISNDKLEYEAKGTVDTGDPKQTQDDRASIQVDPVAITERAQLQTNASFSELVPISFMAQRGTALFPERRKDGMKVNTLVISASVQGSVKDLPDESNIVTHFHPIRERRCAKISCVYWDEYEGAGGGWSKHGCRSTQSRHIESSYTCHCNHLTNFAVLLDLEGDINSRFLDYVSIIGCIVSTWCIILTICSYLGIKKFRSSRPQQIVINICLALLGLYLSFLTGIEQIHLDNGCIAFGALIHFFTLASVAWMSVEATNMYLLFVKVFNANIRHFMIKASLAGWGIPGLIVVISVVLSPDSYSNCKYCFPDSDSKVFYICVIGVVGLLITYNFIVFVLVTRKLTCARTTATKANTSKQETIRRLQNVVAISFLLGVTWIFGLLSFGKVRWASNLIFCALNSFQGLCIFVLFCARQKEIRNAWKTWLLQSVGRSHPTGSRSSTTGRGLSKRKLISETNEEKTTSGIKSSSYNSNGKSKVELSDLKSDTFADEISHNVYAEVKGTTYDEVEISDSVCYSDVDPKDRNLPPIPEEGLYSKEISSAVDQNGACETTTDTPELYMEIGEGQSFINEGDEYQSLTVGERVGPQEYMDLSFGNSAHNSSELKRRSLVHQAQIQPHHTFAPRWQRHTINQ